MLNIEGRQVKTLEEAKNFIRKFINDRLHPQEESGYTKHYDMDLYLPMMMDWILNVPAASEEGFTPSDQLEVMYMEAAWGLCMDGIFRPGPRATSNEMPHDSYGKGYSLTEKGKTWLAEAAPKAQ